MAGGLRHRVDAVPDRPPVLRQGPQGVELYWRDRNLKFHLYDSVAPTPTIQVLLDEITADPTSIFWG